MPNQRGLKPNYYRRVFTDEEKTDKLLKVVGPLGSEGVIDEREAKGPSPIHSNLQMAASILTSGKSLTEAFAADTKKAYLHLIQTAGYRKPGAKPASNSAQLKVTSEGATPLVLQEGDGVYITVNGTASLNIESTGDSSAEFVFFQMSSDE